MKLKCVTLKNFRCYKDEFSLTFDQLTTIVGTNDIGKSTILEALEIFFNNETVKIEQGDANIHSDKQVIIQCDFCDLPKGGIVLDSGEETDLKEEYLTIDEDLLRIRKVYDCTKKNISPQIFIIANHPTVKGGDNLLKLKEKFLQEIVKEKGLDCGFKGNPTMRKAIWKSFGDRLDIKTIPIDVTKASGDDKSIWVGIEKELPIYALFQSDRQSQDSDDEIQNPMKVAIRQAMAEVKDELNKIQEKVRERSMYIAKLTTEAISEISPEIGKELMPTFSSPSDSKLNGLFSISMATEEGIPLNKRGSGIRRMILLGFFKAAAENSENEKRNIIYAIEEPETAQHPNNQKILIDSFIRLANSEMRQIILTTHSPGVASILPISGLRFVTRDEEGKPVLIHSEEDVCDKISKALGVSVGMLSGVKVILCVEGPTDVIAMSSFCRCLREKYKDIIDIDNDERVVIVPLGGATLKHWVEKRYLRKLNCPEVHIYDRDVEKYQKSIDEVNARIDGSWGTLTKKYEIENYLHPDAIKDCYGVDVDTDEDKVPEAFGKAYSVKMKYDKLMSGTKSKPYLSKVFRNFMTLERLEERDPDGEILSWMRRVTGVVNRKA